MVASVVLINNISEVWSIVWTLPERVVTNVEVNRHVSVPVVVLHSIVS